MIELRGFVSQLLVIVVKYLNRNGDIVRGKHFVVWEHGLGTI